MQQISNRPRSCNLTTRYFSSYRQTKVNLLREQSEGYTKLTLELSNSMGPARDPIRAESPPTGTDETLKARATQAWHAWQKLVTIIGYFDLDPVRVLDIILDAFSSHVITHWPFFLQLLHCSQWKREPLPRRAGQSNGPKRQSYCDMTFDEILAAAEGVSPDSAPEDVNTCANLLGFKFKYYQVCSNLVLRYIIHILAGTAPARTDRSHVRGRLACERRNDPGDRYPSSCTPSVLSLLCPLIVSVCS